jgi:hypothetical protein
MLTGASATSVLPKRHSNMASSSLLFSRDDRSRRERAGFAVALLIVLQQLKKMNIRLLWRDRNIENLVKISTFQ